MRSEKRAVDIACKMKKFGAWFREKVPSLFATRRNDVVDKSCVLLKSVKVL